MKMDENGKEWIKWMEMDMTGWKWIEMGRNGEIAGKGWKQLNIIKNQRK